MPKRGEYKNNASKETKRQRSKNQKPKHKKKRVESAKARRKAGIKPQKVIRVTLLVEKKLTIKLIRWLATSRIEVKITIKTTNVGRRNARQCWYCR